MIRPSFKEEFSQISALKLLQNMGWSYLTPEEALNYRENSTRNVLLEDVLREQLKKINRIQYKGELCDFSEYNITNAVNKLKDLPFEGLIPTSEKIFDLLTLGTSFVETIKGNNKSYDLNYIDWENPENNAYHVTDEYNVETKRFNEQHRRPDIILFINGIPVVIIECKSPAITDPIEEAISQHIRNQKKHEIPHLFVFSQILIAVCPSHKKNYCKYGTTGTDMKYWCSWKEESEPRLQKLIDTPLSKDKQKKLFSNIRYNKIKKEFDRKAPRELTHQDIILYGLCQPERLIEFIEKFIVYDAGVKKIARYQQYFAVKKTLEKITSVPDGKKRPDGVIWHTQGSGKSLSMVMLAKSIAMDPKIKNPKIVLITDRKHLDTQIYKTFQNCQISLKKAKNGPHLVELLKSSKATVIATTIFKFETVIKSKNTVLDSTNIIALIDEAHRTQYGVAHTKVRMTFPKACFIAYTGTPLTKKEKDTRCKFGNYFHTYTSRFALEDKVIVPILYEGRVVSQTVTTHLLDRMFERITQGLSNQQKRDLKQKYRNKNQLDKTDQRVSMIAMDISSHFSKIWKGTGFKAQLATNSIAMALKYKKHFDELAEVLTAVIISKTDDRAGHTSVSNEETALEKYERQIKESFGGNYETYEREMISSFDSHEGIDILIVVNKLLTGFDVPRNTVLYLDKKFNEAHTLLQAVARVNRVFEKKNFAYVIDYQGNLKKLLEAVKCYDDMAKKENSEFEMDFFEREEVSNAIHDLKEEIKKLPKHYSDLTSLFDFDNDKKDLSTYESTLSTKKSREQFYEKLSRFGNVLHQAFSSVDFLKNTEDSEIKKYKKELQFFLKLKKHIKEVSAETVNYKDYEPKIEKLLNTYVQAEEAQTIIPETQIYDKDFDSKLENKNTRSKALMIFNHVKKYIAVHEEKDKEFYKRLSKLIQETLDEYQQGRINEIQFLQKAKELKDQALTRTGDSLPPSLKNSDKAKAYYGILKKALASKNNLKEELLADMSLIIEEIIEKHTVVDWFKNQDIQNDMKNDIEDYLNDRKIDFSTLDDILGEVIRTAKSHYRE
ncbi:MAG: type I restriction endonuclease subunit R [Bdellovibrionales bacterium]|nr:type I restriction endonuclease subunit R [Bdellovibrionales bacterium]